MGKKHLIIVCDKKTEKYANFLRQMITKNDDTEDGVVGVIDGSVDVSVWLDKYYSDNKATISSNVYVIFMGESKVCRNEAASMDIIFKQEGMIYGWLGKRGMIRIDKSYFKDKKTFLMMHTAINITLKKYNSSCCNSIEDVLYHTVTLEMYKNGLQKFLEE